MPDAAAEEQRDHIDVDVLDACQCGLEAQPRLAMTSEVRMAANNFLGRTVSVLRRKVTASELATGLRDSSSTLRLLGL